MKYRVVETKEIKDSCMTLEELLIDTARHRKENLALVINNLGSNLLLSFLRNGRDGGKIFEIAIIGGQISFKRFAGRPSREVEDTEMLCVKEQPQLTLRNTLLVNEKLEQLKIPFEGST